MADMQVVHVVPIARGINRNTLSYFSSAAPAVGAVVSVPIRSREVPAIVVGHEEASKQKASLRSSSYAMKKLSTRTGTPLFDAPFVAAVNGAAVHAAAGVGSVFYAATPTAIVATPRGIYAPKEPKEKNTTTDVATEKVVFQASRDERYDRYRSLIREEFARRNSVFLCVPTIEDGEYAYEALKKGIGRYIALLHASLSKKEVRTRWNKAVASNHPVCIIATGTFLSLPRTDLGTIIIEREQARVFKGQTRPYLDVRVLAEKLAEHRHARLIFAGLPLRVETIFRYQNGELDELARLKTRFPGPPATVVDMRNERGIRGDFIVVGDELKAALADAQAQSKSAFVFAARRGLSPTVVCGDCGETVLCRACGAGVVLHKSAGHNVFLCHACGSARSAHETCVSCKGWKLVQLGVGTERVADALAQTFPDAPIRILDHDRAKGHKQAGAVRDAFWEKPGSILVGTEMALAYFHKPLPLVAVASADALLSLPEWRTRERIFSILMQLRELAAERFIIQTRKPDETLFAHAEQGLVAEFYRSEIQSREQFSYPPFSVLITFSVTGSKAAVETEIVNLAEHFKNEGFLAYAPSLHMARGKYVMRGLIRKKRGDWPDDALVAKIRALPPSVAVNVEPDQLM